MLSMQMQRVTMRSGYRSHLLLAHEATIVQTFGDPRGFLARTPEVERQRILSCEPRRRHLLRRFAPERPLEQPGSRDGPAPVDVTALG